MRRLGTEGWAGAAMLVIAVAVTLPVLLSGVELRIPRPLWALLLAVVLAATVLVGVVSRPRRARALLALAVVGTWALVLAVPGTGLLLILLVVTAALSVHVVPLGAGVVIALANTAVVLASGLLIAAPATELLVMSGFYLLIQLASMLSTATLLRETRMRLELSRAHGELQAAQLLLEESARTAERLRISRELHDLIGHQLTVLTLTLEAARHRDAGEARAQVERADQVARSLLADVRTTVGALREGAPDLAHALHRLARDAPGLAVHIDVAEDAGAALDPEGTLALVRLAQEALANTLRHARATQLRIEVRCEQGRVAITAHDDGVGEVAPRLGNGLRGLRERFEGLGGSLEIDGRAGFRLTGRLGAA